MATYPTTSLKPGQSGPEVKKLQEYLVSQGYLTQAEMNTGPGIYGPKTKSAVIKLQQKLGVDVAGNPGYWGPRTLEKIRIGETQQITPSTITPTVAPQVQLTTNGLTPDEETRIRTILSRAGADVTNEHIRRYATDPEFRSRFAQFEQPVTQITQIQAKQPSAEPSPKPGNTRTNPQTGAIETYTAQGWLPTEGHFGTPLTEQNIETQRQFGDLQRQFNELLQRQQQPPPQQDDSAILAMLEKVLDQLTSQNKVINPSVVISDAQILEFLRLAEEEVTPFYQAQLRTAREGLYRNLGYASDEVLRNEQQLEKKYGLRVRQIGEEQAERGFAQSGRRLEEEQLLREETVEQIGAGRRGLEFGAGTAARQFAQQFGAAALPSRTLEERPGVISGIPAFTRTGVQRPLYELSDDVYRGLVGSQEKERLTGIRALAQQREELTRTGQATPVYSQFQPRALTF